MVLKKKSYTKLKGKNFKIKFHRKSLKKIGGHSEPSKQG